MEAFDEFSVIWAQYKVQCEDMARVMYTWMNDQYHVYLTLRKEWQAQSEEEVQNDTR